MQTHLPGRDMITTQEWTKDELDTIIDIALDLKRRRALGESHALLRDKVLAMLFFFSSTRTRASFEAGMAQLALVRVPMFFQFQSPSLYNILDENTCPFAYQLNPFPQVT